MHKVHRNRSHPGFCTVSIVGGHPTGSESILHYAPLPFSRPGKIFTFSLDWTAVVERPSLGRHFPMAVDVRQVGEQCHKCYETHDIPLVLFYDFLPIRHLNSPLPNLIGKKLIPLNPQAHAYGFNQKGNAQFSSHVPLELHERTTTGPQGMRGLPLLPPLLPPLHRRS